MKRIYVAGPITLGDVKTNINLGVAVGDVLMRAGLFPYIPHLTYYWNEQSHHTWEEWLTLDEAWLKLCDAVFRIPGSSKGAERECELANALNIPVFTDIVQLMEWVNGKTSVEIT